MTNERAIELVKNYLAAGDKDSLSNISEMVVERNDRLKELWVRCALKQPIVTPIGQVLDSYSLCVDDDGTISSEMI